MAGSRAANANITGAMPPRGRSPRRMKEEKTSILTVLHEISYWIGSVLLIPAVIIFLAQALYILGVNTTLILPYGFICLISSISFFVAPTVQNRFFKRE